MLIIRLQKTFFISFFILLHLLLACHYWANIIQHFSLHFVLLNVICMLVGYIRDMYWTEGETRVRKKPVFGKQ